MSRGKKPTLIGFVWLLIMLGGALMGCQQNNDRSANAVETEVTELPGETQNDFDVDAPPAGLELNGTEYSWLVVTMDVLEFQALNQSIVAGIEDGISYLNAQGSVFGAEIQLIHTSIDPQTDDLLEQVLAAIDAAEPLVLFMAAPIDEALYYELSQEDLPILYFGFGSPLSGLTAQVGENIFWLVPPPDEQFAFFLSEVWNNWNRLRPSGNVNEVRVGYLDMDQDFPEFQSNPGMDAFLRQNNFEILVRASISSSSTASITNFLVDSISAGITVLYANTFSPGTAVLINDLNTLAVSEFFVAGGGTWSIDSGSKDFFLDGVTMGDYLIVLPTAWWSDEENPAIQLAHSIRAESRRNETYLDAGYLLALGAVDLGAETLRAAIDRVGSANVSGEDVLEQMAVVEDYAVLGGLYTLDFTAGNRSPNFLRLWQVRPGEDWLPIGSGGEVPGLGAETD